MYKSVVKKVHSHLDPWQIYQSIYPNAKICFFLDSHHFQSEEQRYSYIGFSPEQTFELKGSRFYVQGKVKKSYPAKDWVKQLRKVQAKYKTNSRHAFMTDGLIGFFGYELVTQFEKIQFKNKVAASFPKLHLGLYREILIYDHKKKEYWLAALLKTSLGRSQVDLAERYKKIVSKWKPYLEAELPFLPRTTIGSLKPGMPKRTFEQIVRRAKEYIREGDIYQANLSQQFSFTYRGNALSVYEALRDINPSPFSSFFKVGDLHLVSSSPERLILKRGQFCETRPIAGTRPRKTNTKNEKVLKRELKSNPKELAEHLMMVDLERNDLGRVCTAASVRVKEMMAVEKYSHVIHLVSYIEGKLKRKCDVWDLIRAMFPGGTITGCPKIRCMEIIDELEPVPRGVYTGSVGYIGFNGDMDLNIIIRTLVLNRGEGQLQVGAGIVHDSVPSREYQETLYKAEAMVQALKKAKR